MKEELKQINPNFKQNFSSFTMETDYLTNSEINKLINFCQKHNYLIIVSSAKSFDYSPKDKALQNILITLNPIKIEL